ncbi:MAG: transposase [Candidatus Heimdallarchaeota archaeon]|nr:transposase [Candidatus Heimdallarchaeota archaeon]
MSATRRGGVMDAAHEQFSALFHKISRFKEMRPESRNPIIWHDALIELEEIIELISSDCREDVQSFGRKLSNAKSDLLRALQQPELPLTNNHAERCLRPLVIHRKIRGFVASDRGKQTLERFATMFETWNLRGNNPYDEILRILSCGS